MNAQTDARTIPLLTQRLDSESFNDPDFLDKLIHLIVENPGCCDEVWLATKYGFPSMNSHRQAVGQCLVAAERFRANNICVSLQISNTIGHGQYMSSMDCSGLVYEGSPAECMVGSDGIQSPYSFCWNGEHFRRYTLEVVRMYAQIHPYCVWIDDDLRAINHSPVQYGCFCDNCLARFNMRYQASFDRESLVYEINYGNVQWREQYVEFLRDALADFTYTVFSAIHEVSPDSYAGLQYGHHGLYAGSGLDYLFDAMLNATGKPPKSRPGGGAYDDYNPNEQISKCFTIQYLNSLLPDYVTEIRPEIENLPDVVFGKSIPGTCYETSLYLASGANAMSYAMLMNHDNEDMDWHGEMLSAFSRHKPYWEKLAASSLRTYGGGLRVYHVSDMWKRPVNEQEPLFSYALLDPYWVGSELAYLGVSVSHDCKHNPVWLLHPAAAKHLTDRDIQFLLSQPVLTDGESLEIIQNSGYSDCFSAKTQPVDTSKLFVVYNNHPINQPKAGRNWSQSLYHAKGHALIDCTGETEFLDSYNTKSKEVMPIFPEDDHIYGMADGIVKTRYSGKWAVFGLTPWESHVSTDRRNQILRSIDYISNNRLPVWCQSRWQVILFPRENEQGEVTSVSVLNRSVGYSIPLCLHIRRPAGRRFSVMHPCSEEISLEVIYENGEAIVILPPVAPWNLATVFIE